MLSTLNAMRGLAALMVLLFHTWMTCGADRLWFSAQTYFPDPGHLFRLGWVGVDIFFVLSGFVLAYQHAINPVNYKTYILRRLARILPAYWAQLAILATIPVFNVQADIINWISHITLLHNINFAYSSSINGVYWTLPVEFWFYFFVPWIATRLTQKSLRLPLIISLIFIALIWRLSTNLYLPQGEIDQRVWLINQLPGRIDQFLFGMCGGIYFSRRPLSKTTLDRQRNTGILLVTTSLIWMSYIQPIGTPDTQTYYAGHWATLIWPTLFAFGLTIMLTGIAKQKISSRIILHFGKISYGIYLWHFPILIAALPYVTTTKTHNNTTFLLLSATTLLVTTVVASISYWLIEQPFIRLTHKKSAVHSDRNHNA